MRFSPPPDLHSSRRVGLTALVVTVIASIGLIGHSYRFTKTLGDPDDAMRLVLVRDLLAGRGWYDQVITRLQPPIGVVLHWSRLVDGALVALTKAFGLILSPQAAETAMRLTWPLFWILPATWCALAIAQRLGGSLAVFICAVLLASNQQAFAQFIPGRIDHHNIQIVMTLVAASCAMAKENRSRWALMAGVATGLGLVIGLEALPFHVLIGMSYALQSATGGDKRETARSYALSLLGASLLFYCLQTPPWRWSMSFCDAIGLSLVAAIIVASCGLMVITMKRFRTSARSRVLILIATIALAAGVYLALDPVCIGGPLAAVDTRIRPFWFNIVDEMQPLPVILERYWDLGISLAWLSGVLIATVIFMLVRNQTRTQPAILLASALAISAVIGGIEAFRMQSYVFWLGFPLLAVGLSILAARFWGGLMVPTVIVCVLLSPVGIKAQSFAEDTVFGSPHSLKPAETEFHCHDTAEYRRLRALSPGLVLADISIGPFILANTPHSVLNAPYHRMVWGILAAHDALTATASNAERKFRNLKIDYLVECRTSPAPQAPGSVEWDLAREKIPEWLQPLSARSEGLQIYRVRS